MSQPFSSVEEGSELTVSDATFDAARAATNGQAGSLVKSFEGILETL